MKLGKEPREDNNQNHPKSASGGEHKYRKKRKLMVTGNDITIALCEFLQVNMISREEENQAKRSSCGGEYQANQTII